MFGKRSGSDTQATVTAPRPAASAAAQPLAMHEAPPTAPVSDAPVETGRTPFPSAGLGAPLVSAPSPTRAPASVQMVPNATDSRRSEAYYETKSTIFGALIEAIDL